MHQTYRPNSFRNRTYQTPSYTETVDVGRVAQSVHKSGVSGYRYGYGSLSGCGSGGLVHTLNGSAIAGSRSFRF